MTRRALVTGGSMGIGRACAELLAANGWRVVIAARGERLAREAAAALPGSGHEALRLHVGDAGEWTSMADTVAELDGVVHAAGVIGPVGRLTEVGPAEFMDTLQINVLGTFLTARACQPALRTSGGAMVAFGGGGATGPQPRFDAYAASKAATVRLVENLAADGMRINAVSPGFVATRMHDATLEAGPDAAGPEYYERTRRELEQGGTSVRDAAELVHFLLGDEAREIRGRLISAPWDPWREPAWRERLGADKDLATIRRIDDQFFTAA
jgi:NAD(P)-dependent dehydrogenase (short-subunit alcohol dehydrogenase family)